MNIHVITPFFRVGNLEELVPYLEKERVIWHPVVDYPITFAHDWIDPVMVEGEIPDDWHVGSYKTHYFLTHYPMTDDDYYCFMCDDDLYEDGFFDKIRSCTEDVIVVSMKRGQHVIDSTGIPHGIETLVAAPQNMKRGWVSSQQYIVRGRVLKTVEIDRSGWADGILAEDLYARYPIRYEPNWYALFNYLQPGRWDK